MKPFFVFTSGPGSWKPQEL